MQNAGDFSDFFATNADNLRPVVGFSLGEVPTAGRRQKVKQAAAWHLFSAGIL
jgi:hypothetical protein